MSSSSSAHPPSTTAGAGATTQTANNKGGGVGLRTSTNHKTTSSSTRRRMITPPEAKTASTSSSLTKRMTVDKHVVDELLLVCGVIGTTTTAANETNKHKHNDDTDDDEEEEDMIVPVTDCLNWLQDLQRALRRDDDLYRPISLLLGNWNIVQQKLLPLVVSCRYDSALVLTVLKILVILTKPLHENTVRAGRMVIDTKSSSSTKKSTAMGGTNTNTTTNPPPMIMVQEQIKLRENALQQADLLLSYKRSITHHSSHHRHLKKTKQPKQPGQPQPGQSNSSGSNGDGGLLSIFVSLLAEPLSKTGTARTDADHLTIELVLHLLKNLLSAEPLLGGAEQTYKAQQLHNELIGLLEQELVLEILLTIAADLEARENAPYNLLVLELLHHLLRQQDPTAVAKCGGSSSGGSNGSATSTSSHTENVSLARILAREAAQKRSMLQNPGTSSRHSHFGGGTIMAIGATTTGGGDANTNGKQLYVSASRIGDKRSLMNQPGMSTTTVVKRKNKKTDPFVGVTTSAGAASTALQASRGGGPAQVRAWKVLDAFCQRFLENCYGAVLKSWKNEFRRDSVRLQHHDLVWLMRIVWFFMQWRRVSVVSGKSNSSNSSELLGPLIFTMDVFTFNMVLTATDTYTQHKQWPSLAQAIALLSEMMHWLYTMFNSTSNQDSKSKEQQTTTMTTEHIMALGLMDRLFYASEPIDRLPKLLARWEPGTTTRKCLSDLVEVCHVTLKLLDANAKACKDDDAAPVLDKKKKKKDASSNNKQLDTIAKMKAAAADFDVNSYFARKIVSNQTVYMYTQLLSQYATNPPHTNHRILAFFLRLKTFTIAVADRDNNGDEDNDEQYHQLHPLASRTVTLEPMLYSVQMLIVLDKILNDQTIRKDPKFAEVLKFATNFVRKFARAAQENPLLYVEALFKHPVPHRFCDLSTNLYVSEELRMLAERDLLLEEQSRLDTAVASSNNNDDNSDDGGDTDGGEDEGEQELEFEDFGGTAPQPNNKKRKVILGEGGSSNKRVAPSGARGGSTEDDDDDDDDSDNSPSNAAMMRKSDKKKQSKAIQDSDDDDDDGVFEQPTTSAKVDAKKSTGPASSNNPGSRDDYDDDESEAELESSPRVGRSKSNTTASASALDDSSDSESEEATTKKADKSKSKRPPVRASNLDSSDDDEDDLLASMTTAPTTTTRKNNNLPMFDDNDESSDGDSVPPQGSKKDGIEETIPSQRRILAVDSANDSDEDDGIDDGFSNTGSGSGRPSESASKKRDEANRRRKEILRDSDETSSSDDEENEPNTNTGKKRRIVQD